MRTTAPGGPRSRRPVRRLGLVTAALGLGVVLSACGTGASTPSGTGTPTTSAGPAAKIDPNAHGVFTGPINQARSTVDSLNQQQDQQQQQTGGG